MLQTSGISGISYAPVYQQIVITALSHLKLWEDFQESIYRNYRITNKRRKNSCRTCHYEVSQKNYGCKRTGRCGLIANRCSTANLNFACVSHMNCCFPRYTENIMTSTNHQYSPPPLHTHTSKQISNTCYHCHIHSTCIAWHETVP